MLKEKRTVVITLCILIGIIILGGYITYELTSPNGYYARRHADILDIVQDENAPYTNLQGDIIEISDFQGTPLIINVWASWSPFSKSDFEILGEIKKQYGDKVVIIAMNRMETKETALAYLNSIGRTEGLQYVVDPNDKLFKNVEGYAMPETLFYDEVGNIIFHKRGSLMKEEMTQFVGGIIKEE